MSRIAQLVTGLGVLFLVTSLMHTYFWWRLIGTTELPKSWRLYLALILILLAFFFPLPFFASRYFAAPWREMVLWIGFVWMGVAFLLFVTLLAAELPRLFLSKSYSHWITLSALAATLLLSSFALWSASREPIVKKIQISLPKLPPSMSGTTILQISDLHAGGLVSQKQIDSIFQITKELEPDLIVITGDLIDGSTKEQGKSVVSLGELEPKEGLYFVTGNHEYYSGVSDWLTYLEKLGVRVLQNERVRIGNEREGFDLAGVHDPTSARFASGGPDLEKALQGRDVKVALVLLAHNPRNIEESRDAGVDLQISGHTHAGQLWPFNFIVKIFYPHVEGLYQVGETQLYVNPGTGYWGPPMRLGTRSEITLIELVSGSKVPTH